jgi:hypothetical protein
MFAIIYLLATFMADLFKSRRRLEVENLSFPNIPSGSCFLSIHSWFGELLSRTWCAARLHPYPTPRRSRCCARAASGQAAAPPSSVMNSRRPMRNVI